MAVWASGSSSSGTFRKPDGQLDFVVNQRWRAATNIELAVYPYWVRFVNL